MLIPKGLFGKKMKIGIQNSKSLGSVNAKIARSNPLPQKRARKIIFSFEKCRSPLIKKIRLDTIVTHFTEARFGFFELKSILIIII
jgi:hypothetical protein